MSAAENSPAPRRTRFGCLGLICLAALVLLIPELGIPPLQLGTILLFGWITFIADVWPRISWNLGAIFTGILCFALIFFLAHSFLNWLSRNIASAKGKSFHWPWKWTACGVAAIGLYFLVGMAVAGAAHQIGWIAQSQESLYENSFRKFEPYHQMGELDMIVAQYWEDGQTVSGLRTSISEYLVEERRIPPDRLRFESLHVLILANPAGVVEAVLVFPRDFQSRQRFGGEMRTASDSQHLDSGQLLKFVETNNTRLVAF